MVSNAAVPLSDSLSVSLADSLADLVFDAHASAPPPADRPQYKVWPKRLPRQLVVPNTSLWYSLEVTATRFPDKAAYIFFGRPLSFGELKSQAEALAGWLQSVGVKAGDRVGIYMQNCPQYAVAYYGILRANAVVVPINPMNRAEELKHYITDPQTRVLICTADLAAMVAQANAGVPEAERVAQVLVTRFTDTMPAGPIAAHDAPQPAMDAWLRSDPELASTPVIVLTTSQDERDKAEAYKLNVAGYLLKPVEFSEFVALMAAVNNYWALVTMP